MAKNTRSTRCSRKRSSRGILTDHSPACVQSYRLQIHCRAPLPFAEVTADPGRSDKAFVFMAVLSGLQLWLQAKVRPGTRSARGAVSTHITMYLVGRFGSRTTFGLAPYVYFGDREITATKDCGFGNAMAVWEYFRCSAAIFDM